LKSIYFDFIDGICKPPDRRIAPVNEDGKDGAYSEKDEYKAALKQEETQNIFGMK
jgi:hypothetical protein